MCGTEGDRDPRHENRKLVRDAQSRRSMSDGLGAIDSNHSGDM